MLNMDFNKITIHYMSLLYMYAGVMCWKIEDIFFIVIQDIISVSQ